MDIYIKNMVCQGTKLLVLNELGKLGLNYKTFGPGKLEFEKTLSLSEIQVLESSLSQYGLKLSISKK
jgi:hypothetical protein